MIESYTDLLTHSLYGPSARAMVIIWFMRSLLFPALVSMLLVRLTIWVSHQYDVMARPSDRGSHSIPTPRLGGLGSAAAFFITAFVLSHWRLVAPLEPWRLVLLVGGAWALIGGALDDFQELSPRWKLLVQAAAVGSVLTFGFAPNQLDLPLLGTVTIPAFAGVITAMLVCFFMMNIFNFMDGMDGQAAVFGIITGLTMAIYIANHGFRMGLGIIWTNMYLAAMAAICVGSLLGLLWHNYPGREMRWKTFMGDCGSQFYGFVLAVIALQAGVGPQQEALPWAASLILFSPFIYDVCFTLIRRYRRGERLSQAHRTHLYQRLMVAGWSHGKTLKLNVGLYVICAVLAYVYGRAYATGIVQILCIIVTGCVLAGYTWFVVFQERLAEKHPELRAIAEK